MKGMVPSQEAPLPAAAQLLPSPSLNLPEFDITSSERAHDVQIPSVAFQEGAILSVAEERDGLDWHETHQPNSATGWLTDVRIIALLSGATGALIALLVW